MLRFNWERYLHVDLTPYARSYPRKWGTYLLNREDSMRSDRVFTEEATKDLQVKYPSIFTDEEYEELLARRSYQRHGTVCPTCNDSGTYRWQGVEHLCPVDFDNKCLQWKYWRMYELSNIPERYMKLNWEILATSQPETKEKVDEYVSHLPDMMSKGIGLYLYSEQLGTGKTFCSTHILKEAAKLDYQKRKYRGYFVRFEELLSTDSPWLMDKAKTTPIVVIDDVAEPFSRAQQELYARRLEEVTRYRNDLSLPTIVSSNMPWNVFEELFPRCHSTLSDTVRPLGLTNTFDSRVQRGVSQNLEAALAGETSPIT